MSDESAKSGSWSRGRWWFVVVLIFAVHIGLIFAFGDRKPIVPRQPAFTPELRMITGGHEMLALNDPTLFALPHLNGFSGVAWLQSQLPRIEPEPFRVTEAPRWLLLPVERLGEAFSQFMKTNQFAEFSPELKPAPFLRVPELSLVNSVSGAQSGLRIEGDLALRKLLNPPSLPSQPAADLLTPSFVRVLADTDGNVISAVVLRPGSGSKDADREALDLAKSVRFAPLPRDDQGSVTWTQGRMVFDWLTIPLPQTNAPSADQ